MENNGGIQNQEPDEKKNFSGAEPVKEIHHYYHERKEWGFGRFFLGAFFVILGLFYLIRSAGWMPKDIDLNWSLLWPLLIILFGLSLIRIRSAVGKILGIIFSIIIVLIMVFFVFAGNWITGTNFGNFEVQDIKIEKDENAKGAEILVKAGAGTLMINGGAVDLVNGILRSDFMKLNVSTGTDGNYQRVKLTGESKIDNFFDIFGNKQNKLALSINDSIPVDLRIDAGAVDLGIDLTSVRINRLDINTGVSSVKINAGDKLDQSELNIKGGASSVSIILPENLGARVEIKSGLTSRSFKDFTEISKDIYQSNNYSVSEKKVDINLELGASSIEITRK